MNIRTLSILTITATLGLASTAATARPVNCQGQRTCRANVLERFDADGDGKLSVQERAEAKQARQAWMLKRFAANGDGVIDDTEKKATRKGRNERRGKRRHRMLENFDIDGDGQLDEQEWTAAREARRANIRQRSDVIDDTEKNAIRKGRNERRGKWRHRMLENFDINGDGVLDDDERKTRRHRNREHRQDRRPVSVPGTEA
jgi:Ca2+-binding EF-hand superfamily protein